MKKKKQLLSRKAWNTRLKKIAAIEKVKLPKLPKKTGYTVMFERGLNPVRAMVKIIAVGEFTAREEWKGSEEEFVAYLEEMGVKKVTEGLDDGEMWDWFPSEYEDASGGEPYPTILAEALIASQSNESITDVANIYYKDRKMTPKAKKLFMKDALSAPGSSLKFIQVSEPQMVWDFFKKHTKLAKKIFLQAPKNGLKEFFMKPEEPWERSEAFSDLFELMPEVKKWVEKNLPDFDMDEIQ